MCLWFIIYSRGLSSSLIKSSGRRKHRSVCLSICNWLNGLLLAVTSPWRRVSALSVTESGRLSAVAADSKLTDSLGASNRHFGVRELRVGSSDERDEKGDTGSRWEPPWWLLWRRSKGEDGREGERIKTWGWIVRQATGRPLRSAAMLREARAEGPVVPATPLARLK